MRMILALVVLGAVGLGLLAWAGDGAQAETVCWGTESGQEKCWTFPDPEPTLPPPPPIVKPSPPEPMPTPTPIDQFCFKLPGPDPEIVCIPN